MAAAHRPLQKPIEIHLEGREGDSGFFVFRRMVRAWRVADARASGDPRRIVLARRMLNVHRSRSETHPVSEWITQSDARIMLELLAGQGYVVRKYEKAAKPATAPVGA